MCNKTKIFLALRADISFVAKFIGYLMIEFRHSEEQKKILGNTKEQSRILRNGKESLKPLEYILCDT